MFLKAGELNGNIAVIIKMSGRPFHAHKKVVLKEFCYFPDKMSKESQMGIVADMMRWIETGEFDGHGADLCNQSP